MRKIIGKKERKLEGDKNVKRKRRVKKAHEENDRKGETWRMRISRRGSKNNN